MFRTYRSESSDPKLNAQRNLSGRTHYVDDDTLRFHKSRILSTHIVDGGLLFALVESVAADMHNTKRGVRYVIFDMFGEVIGNRANLDSLFKRREKATEAMWAELNSMNAKELTLDAITKARAAHTSEMDDLLAKVLAHESKKSEG